LGECLFHKKNIVWINKYGVGLLIYNNILYSNVHCQLLQLKNVIK